MTDDITPSSDVEADVDADTGAQSVEPVEAAKPEAYLPPSMR